LPALAFNSVGPQYLSTPAFNLGTFTIFMVTSPENGTTGLFWCRSTAGSQKDTLYSSNHTIIVTRAAVLSGWDQGVNWGQFGGSTKAREITVQYDGTHAGHLLRINAVQQTMTSAFANDPGTSTTNDKFTIAADDTGAGPSTINVAEVMVFNRSLTQNELAVLEDYARRRYNLF